MMKNIEKNKGEIIIYQNKSGRKAVDVRLAENTVWLSQKQMSELFNKDVRTINEHIVNVFKERELDKNQATIRKFRIAHSEREFIKNLTCSVLEQVAIDDEDD